MSSIGKLVPPPSLPPEVLRFLVWLDKTEGRDKLYRLIVYASKLIVDSLRPYSVTAQTADIVQRLERGAAVVATSRKLFRMFRSLESGGTATHRHATTSRTAILPLVCPYTADSGSRLLSCHCLPLLSQVSAGCTGELCVG